MGFAIGIPFIGPELICVRKCSGPHWAFQGLEISEVILAFFESIEEDSGCFLGRPRFRRIGSSPFDASVMDGRFGCC